MSNELNQNLLEAVLDSWDRNNTIMLNLLQTLPQSSLGNRAMENTVGAQIGKTRWKTSLFPKEGGYVVPVKLSVRKAESLEEGDSVTVRLEVGS